MAMAGGGVLRLKGRGAGRGEALLWSRGWQLGARRRDCGVGLPVL